MLRALARLHPATAGTVLLDGTDISAIRPRDLARRLGVLPQVSEAPEGITVMELVARGRHPHQSMFRQWSAADEAAVCSAMAEVGVAGLGNRLVSELSGGQRQKVWIAMALAQETDLLLLDEPTTFLDLAHQIEVLDLCQFLNSQGKTLVVVLHDLNLACRYASHLVVMSDGLIFAQGKPAEVMSEALVEQVFGLPSLVMPDPLYGTPMVLPKSRLHRQRPGQCCDEAGTHAVQEQTDGISRQ